LEQTQPAIEKTPVNERIYDGYMQTLVTYLKSKEYDDGAIAEMTDEEIEDEAQMFFAKEYLEESGYSPAVIKELASKENGGITNLLDRASKLINEEHHEASQIELAPVLSDNPILQELVKKLETSVGQPAPVHEVEQHRVLHKEIPLEELNATLLERAKEEKREQRERIFSGISFPGVTNAAPKITLPNPEEDLADHTDNKKYDPESLLAEYKNWETPKDESEPPYPFRDTGEKYPERKRNQKKQERKLTEDEESIQLYERAIEKLNRLLK
jgi:hypothetical protein